MSIGVKSDTYTVHFKILKQGAIIWDRIQKRNIVEFSPKPTQDDYYRFTGNDFLIDGNNYYFITLPELPIGTDMQWIIELDGAVISQENVRVTEKYIFIGGGTHKAGDALYWVCYEDNLDNYRFAQAHLASGENACYIPPASVEYNIGEPPKHEEGFPTGPDNNGESTDKGGDAEQEDYSDPILIDDKRTLFLGNLFRVYKVTPTSLSALSNYLVSPEFLDVIAKLFTDPMDYLTSLTAIPYSFSGVDSTLQIGNQTTNIGATRINDFFADIDCGSIAFEPFFATFMDYSPYTRIQLYLPGIGYVDVNVDAFMNDTLKLKYRVDVLTGQCVAFLSNTRGLIATYNGNIAYHIPLRSKDYSSMISGILATGASLANNNPYGVITGGIQTMMGGIKPNVSTSGSFSGNSGALMNRKPYLIIARPQISIPRTYASQVGFQSKITYKLADCSGFTKVLNVHLDHVTATDSEKAEILAKLQAGVIL